MIDYNKPYQTLTIDVSSALNKNFDATLLPRDNTRSWVLWEFSHEKNNLFDLVSYNWAEYLRGIGFPIEKAFVFYRKHPNETIAHTDLPNINYKCLVKYALNWVISEPDDSSMAWYENPGYEGKHEILPLGQPYMSWPISDVKETHRLTLGKEVSVVRVDTVHGIILGDNERYAISIRVRPPDPCITWDDVINRLKPYIKE